MDPPTNQHDKEISREFSIESQSKPFDPLLMHNRETFCFEGPRLSEELLPLVHISIEAPPSLDIDRINLRDVRLSINLALNGNEEDRRTFKHLKLHLVYVPGVEEQVLNGKVRKREGSREKIHKSYIIQASSVVYLADLPHLPRIAQMSDDDKQNNHEFSLIFSAIDFIHNVKNVEHLNDLLHCFPVGIWSTDAVQSKKDYCYRRVDVDVESQYQTIGYIRFRKSGFEFNERRDVWQHTENQSQDGTLHLPPQPSAESATSDAGDDDQKTEPLELKLTIHVFPRQQPQKSTVTNLPTEILLLIYNYLFLESNRLLGYGSPSAPFKMEDWDWRNVKNAFGVNKFWKSVAREFREHLKLVEKSDHERQKGTSQETSEGAKKTEQATDQDPKTSEDRDVSRSELAPSNSTNGTTAQTTDQNRGILNWSGKDIHKTLMRDDCTAITKPEPDLKISKAYGRSIAEVILEQREGEIERDTDAGKRQPNQNLGHLVKAFSMESLDSLTNLHLNHPKRYWHIVMIILQYCANLTDLEIYQHPESQFKCPSTFIFTNVLMSLQHLELCYFHSERARSAAAAGRRYRKWRFSEIVSCLDAWKKLEFLDLMDVDCQHERNNYPLPPHDFVLKTLALVRCDIDVHQFEYLVKRHRQPNQIESLKALDVVDCPRLNLWDLADVFHGPPSQNLSAFTYRSRGHASTEESSLSESDMQTPILTQSPPGFIDFLSGCKSLRNIHMEGCGEGGCRNCNFEVEKLLPKLSGLHTLFLGYCHTPPAILIGAFKKEKEEESKELKELSIKTWYGEWSRKEMWDLWERIEEINKERSKNKCEPLVLNFWDGEGDSIDSHRPGNPSFTNLNALNSLSSR